jgi:hypothetical protein
MDTAILLSFNCGTDASTNTTQHNTTQRKKIIEGRRANSPRIIDRVADRSMDSTVAHRDTTYHAIPCPLRRRRLQSVTTGQRLYFSS